MEPSSVNVVIYHANCNDGFGAAYSAWKLLGNRAEYFAASHGAPPPDVTGKKVVVLDFSYNNETTKQMIEQAEELWVIDHHKSNMVELHDISNTHFDTTRANIEFSNAEAIDCPTEVGKKPSSNHPFKGNICLLYTSPSPRDRG